MKKCCRSDTTNRMYCATCQCLAWTGGCITRSFMIDCCTCSSGEGRREGTVVLITILSRSAAS